MFVAIALKNIPRVTRHEVQNTVCVRLHHKKLLFARVFFVKTTISICGNVQVSSVVIRLNGNLSVMDTS
ncbi:uncharacterized protein PHALS_15210 [Plasmopara halstedii]|uniref:Uncharacterized protein n=1 Tax=Plasmopara halstedii TaxID=4781 RepID=A0A0P1B5A3_PLAHL|nr:uncharacterized protein PHALS_15210 [Plasmopara halstedii]CEG49346.1 hypothetical protein PHALS_15210 [Plasmopara halstedii]|eukprot:XP_024585715.1 hypothetical protein PHALS_15210 [Plasmopara halstedii]